MKYICLSCAICAAMFLPYVNSKYQPAAHHITVAATHSGNHSLMILLFFITGMVIGFIAAFIFFCNQFAKHTPPLERTGLEHER